MKTLDENQLCKCQEKAVDIIYDSDKQEILLVCESCKKKILDQTNPEYKECCPNCGCCFGVN